MAKAIAVTCVRNTYLEDIHAGKVAKSKTGDFSDVIIETPSGSIPWNEASRISEDEIRILMKQVLNQLYTFLKKVDDPEFLHRVKLHTSSAMREWDKPELLENFLSADGIEDLIELAE